MNFTEIELDKALKYTQPTKYIVDSTDYDDDFETPVLTAGKNFLLGYTDEIEGVFKNVPAIIFDDFTTSFHYVDFPFKVKLSALKILNARNEQFDIKYIYYLMKGVKIDTELHKRYWISRFSKKTIPFPTNKSNIRNPKSEIENISLSTQKRIAEILDNAAALRDKTQQLLTEYDQLAQSIFLDMFGDPVTNPKGWENSNLGDLSVLITKGSSPKWQGFEYISEGIRFVTSENVRLGYLDCSKDKFVAEDFHEKLKRSQLREKDILVNLVGASIGRGALVNYDVLPANINQAVAKIELKVNKINPIYALNLIITPQIQNKLIGNKVEGARANISLKNVNELKILTPPIHLQNQFAEKIALIEQQKDLAKQELQESEDLFQALLQKAFKGELN